MQILTRHNIVVDYCESGYVPMGSVVVCPAKGRSFENCTVITVDSVPEDIEAFKYSYENGKFYRNDIALMEFIIQGYYNRTEMDVALEGKSSKDHNHNDKYYTETEVDNLLSEKAPAYTYGTDDLTAGTSALETGKLYFVYE